MNELSSNSLKALNIGIYTHESDLERMPTLEEVFSAIPDGMGINIEIKAHYMFDFSTARALHAFLKNRLLLLNACQLLDNEDQVLNPSLR